MITKKQAIKHFGTASNLAKVLGVSKGAVSQWRDIPQVHVLRLKYEIAPELFKSSDKAA